MYAAIFLDRSIYEYELTDYLTMAYTPLICRENALSKRLNLNELNTHIIDQRWKLYNALNDKQYMTNKKKKIKKEDEEKQSLKQLLFP